MSNAGIWVSNSLICDHNTLMNSQVCRCFADFFRVFAQKYFYITNTNVNKPSVACVSWRVTGLLALPLTSCDFNVFCAANHNSFLALNLSVDDEMLRANRDNHFLLSFPSSFFVRNYQSRGEKTKIKICLCELLCSWSCFLAMEAKTARDALVTSWQRGSTVSIFVSANAHI